MKKGVTAMKWDPFGKSYLQISNRDLDKAIRCIAAVREAVGEQVDLLIEAHGRFDVPTGIKIAQEVAPFRPMFLEEPVFADDIPGLAQFKRGTDIPLATGEHEYTKFGVRDLILAQAADYVQCDVTRCGGFTEMLKIIGMTQAWNLAFAPHGMEYMHMHLMSAAPNAVFLERLFMFEEVSEMVLKEAPQPVNGYLELPDRPGLGLVWDMDRIKEICVK